MQGCPKQGGKINLWRNDHAIFLPEPGTDSLIADRLQARSVQAFAELRFGGTAETEIHALTDEDFGPICHERPQSFGQPSFSQASNSSLLGIRPETLTCSSITSAGVVMIG